NFTGVRIRFADHYRSRAADLDHDRRDIKCRAPVDARIGQLTDEFVADNLSQLSEVCIKASRHAELLNWGDMEGGPSRTRGAHCYHFERGSPLIMVSL